MRCMARRFAALAIKYAAVAAKDDCAARRGGKGEGTTCGFSFPLDLHSFPFSCMGAARAALLLCMRFAACRTECLGIQWTGYSARPDRPALSAHMPRRFVFGGVRSLRPTLNGWRCRKWAITHRGCRAGCPSPLRILSRAKRVSSFIFILFSRVDCALRRQASMQCTRALLLYVCSKY